VCGHDRAELVLTESEGGNLAQRIMSIIAMCDPGGRANTVEVQIKIEAEVSTVCGSLILALASAIIGGSSSRLADIGPAPRTVLVDSEGKPFDLAKMRGKVVLVSFVYTTCNGVCPLTTQALAGVQKKLREALLWGKSVEFVSITLDPKRDTSRVLRDYGRLFKADPAAWHFVTGSEEKVNEVIKAWDMWVKSDSKGVLDHPSRVFLIDGRGRQREIYNLEFLTARTVVEDVRSLIDEK
jgi:protein SCO1/2